MKSFHSYIQLPKTQIFTHMHREKLEHAVAGALASLVPIRYTICGACIPVRLYGKGGLFHRLYRSASRVSFPVNREGIAYRNERKYMG